MADLVAARTGFVVTVDGRTLVVRAGDLFLASDPIVAANPGRFTKPQIRSSASAPWRLPPPRRRAPAPETSVAQAPAEATEAEASAESAGAEPGAEQSAPEPPRRRR